MDDVLMVLSGTRAETTRVGQPLVCVVDDDTAMLRALRLLIAISGFCVETFASAEQFLECPALASDRLSGSGRSPRAGRAGWTCRQASPARGHRSPIIFMTAYDDAPTRERARRSGAVEYLTKPFDERALIDAIHRAIGRA